MQILLADDVLVSSDQNLKEFSSYRSQQISVGELTPTHLVRGFDLMRVEEISQGDRGALVEEDTQLRNLGGTKAFGSMVEDSTHLFVCDARKPLQELGGLRPVFEVLK